MWDHKGELGLGVRKCRLRGTGRIDACTHTHTHTHIHTHTIEGGPAIVDLIFGDANPSAKLAQAWPRSAVSDGHICACTQ